MNFVQTISASEYIGDSLGKINDNFSNLNTTVLLLSTGDIINSSVYTLSASYNEIVNTVNRTNSEIERYLTPTLCGCRLSCKPDEAFTLDSVETDRLYLHPYSGDYISVFNSSKQAWEPYEIKEVKQFYLNEDSVNPGKTTQLSPSSVYGVFIGAENNALKLFFIRPTLPNSVENLYRSIGFLDEVPVYRALDQQTQKFNNLRFLGLVKTNKYSKCTNSHETMGVYNYNNNINTVYYSSSAVNFFTFEEKKYTYNSVIPDNYTALINVDGDLHHTVDSLNFFDNFTLNVKKGLHTLTLSAETVDALISITLNS